MLPLTEHLLKKNISAVIFDLDDTLYPEILYVKSGFKAVSSKIKKDYNADCYDLMLRLFESERANVYNRTLDSLGIEYNDEYICELIDLYRGHKPLGLKFYDDVLPFLNEIKSLGLMTGIITDGRVEGQNLKLSSLGCRALFDGIIITDELGGTEFRKPRFEAFEIMCRNFKVDFCKAAYIGDNPAKDFYIGTLGMFTVRVKRDNALNLCGDNYYKDIKENLFIRSLV